MFNPEKTNTPSQEKQPEVRTFFIRHSRASYINYADKLSSDSPESPLDIDKQRRDLPEAGITLAHEEARKFFSEFRPASEVVDIVSSNQMRALETAEIYASTAKEMGIEVIRHEKTGTEIAQNVGGGDVRSLETLSLHMQNQVLGNIFNPPAQLPPINWENVTPEIKEQFEQAREIVLADDRGSWGANFNAHASKIREFIPEMETPEELYQTQFQDIKRLAEFARRKGTGDKRVNVLAFGHENYMGAALEHDTGKEAIGNTEAVEMLSDGSLKRM